MLSMLINRCVNGLAKLIPFARPPSGYSRLCGKSTLKIGGTGGTPPPSCITNCGYLRNISRHQYYYYRQVRAQLKTDYLVSSINFSLFFLFPRSITTSKQPGMDPTRRRQLVAARHGSRSLHGSFAPVSFAQLVALKLLELLHPAGKLPVEAGDVEVVVDMGESCAETGVLQTGNPGWKSVMSRNSRCPLAAQCHLCEKSHRSPLVISHRHGHLGV